MEEKKIKRPLIWITGAYVLGEVMAYWFGKIAEYGGKAAIVGSLFPAAVMLAAGILFWLEEKVRKRGLFLFMLVIFCLSGWFRMETESKEWPLEAVLQEKSSLRVKAGGRIKKVILKEGTYSIILSPVTVTAGGKQYEEKSLMVSVEEGRISTALFDDTNEKGGLPEEGRYLYGEGKAELFQEARNPGEFDYRLYYRSQKLRFRMKADSASVSGGMTAFHSHLNRFRRFVREALSFLYREEDRGVFQAVLLGDKSDMSAGLRSLYQDGGIAHILAVSGLHVSLIGMGVYGFLRKRGFGYGGAGAAASILLFFYGCVTGFGSSVFRAIFMVLCAFFAAYLGRTYDLLSAMSLSLVLLAADSPYLLFTSGLQLSYGAAGAVGLAGTWKMAVEKRTPNPEQADAGGGILSAFSVSISIQLVTFPIILYHFFEFPLYGIVLNLVVIPLMACAAGSGIISVSFYGLWKAAELWEMVPVQGMGKLFEIVCRGAAGPGHYILLLYRELCLFALKLPFATVITGRPPFWSIVFYYAVLAFLYLYNVREAEKGGEGKSKMKRTTPPVLLLCAVLLLAVRPRIRGLEAYFLDVGQGDAVFFHSGTTAALMDCGSSQYKSVGKNRLVPFLKSRGIRKLDYIFVSHGDSDHINGLVWMLENEEKIQVEHIIMPAPGRDGEVYREIEALGRTRGAKISYMEAGKSLQEEELQITAVHPAKDTFYEDRNSHSLVLSVRYRDFSMLLTGDIDQKGERRIMEWEDLKAKEEQVIPGNLSVLKAAHHGSATSTGRELLERVNPAITILSYGRGNSYGHPSKEVVKRLEEAGTGIWSTEVSGAVHIKTDGRKMKAEGFLLDKNRGLGL